LGHRNTSTLEKHVHPLAAHRAEAVRRMQTYNITEAIAEFERIAQKSAKSGELSLQKPLQ
jgi:hypothetical protein